MFTSTKKDGYNKFGDQKTVDSVVNNSDVNEDQVRRATAAISQQPQQASRSFGGPEPGFTPVLPFINQQPGASQRHMEWMPLPATSANCSPGLAYLHELDRWLVQYQIELFECTLNLFINITN